METLDALLLGRRTYDIFAGYWSHHTDGPEGFIGQLFDRVPKYVASRDSGIALDWQNSVRVGDDLASEIAGLREKHQDVHVIGSIDFVQTLLHEQLYDELQLWVYPLVLGRGKKVFPEGSTPANLRLLHAESGDGGTLLLRYAPVPGEVETGTMGSRIGPSARQHPLHRLRHAVLHVRGGALVGGLPHRVDRVRDGDAV